MDSFLLASGAVAFNDETLTRLLTSEDSSFDGEFVQLFKDALDNAEAGEVVTYSNPYGHEVGDFLLSGHIVDRYSLHCHQKGPASTTDEPDYWNQVTYLLSTVPSSLKKAVTEAQLGAKSQRVVQFCLDLVDGTLDVLEEDEHPDEASATDLEQAGKIAETTVDEVGREQ